MSEFKGTKGKWKLINGWDKDGKGKYFPSVLLFGNEKMHYETLGRCSIVINTSHNQEAESIMANAILISKAPEMLEMLMTIENDNNQVPEWLWDKIQTLIKEATTL